MIAAAVHVIERDTDGCLLQTSYTLSTDAGYNPDAAADLANRVIAMRDADIDPEQFTYDDETEETHE